MKNKHLSFQGDLYVVEKANYPMNGGAALVLLHPENGDRLIATVNLPSVPLAANQVLIKDYSELEGVLETLVKSGIVEPTGRYVTSGFVRLPICTLKI